MSWLSKGLKKVKSGIQAVVPDAVEHLVNTNVRGLGRTVDQYGVPVAMGALALGTGGLSIPGTMAAMAALKGGASLAKGDSFNDTLKAGATGAATGAASGLAGKALGAVSSHLPSVPGGLAPMAADGVASAPETIPAAPGLADIDWGKVGNVGLSAARGLNDAYMQRRQMGREDALDERRRDAYNDDAALREWGRQGMMRDARPDLSSLTAIRNSGPFAGSMTPTPTAPAMTRPPIDRTSLMGGGFLRNAIGRGQVR